MSTDRELEPQRDVQRLLGRCMLRLQQYERLMKAVLAQHELTGTFDKLQGERVSKAEEFSTKTLGQTVKALFETYVVPEGFERDLLPDATTPTDRISFAFSSRVTMEAERLAEVRSAVEELVKLRNDLVHHLIEQFDLWTEDGCSAAIAHLTAAYARIDKHFDELRTWAKGMEEARAMAAQVMQTETFHELLVNGIASDGSFDWPATGIVSVLREATKGLAEDGWTSLESAKAWIQEHHPEQTPEKYGCRTWPQVLTESKLFDLTYRFAEDGRKREWFRFRSA